MNHQHLARQLSIWALILWALGASYAQAQESISAGDEIRGQANGSVREYVLRANAGDIFIISLLSEDFDPYLTIRNPSGRVIAEDDDGGFGLDARLRFVAPADGGYSVLVGAAFGEPPSGDFTLRISAVDTPRAVRIGDDNILIQAGEPFSAALFTFDAEAGQIISLGATSLGDDDIAIILYGPDGVVVAEDDDSGGGLNPLLVAQNLPTSGVYSAEIYEIYGNNFTADIVISLTEARFLSLDEAGRVIEMGADAPPQLLRFPAIGGITYRLNIAVNTPQRGDFAITATGASDGAQLGYLNASNVLAASLDIISETSGDVYIQVESFINEPSAYTVRIEPVKR